MKKINQKGFVLAETLVVAVFLMAIFTLIFTNFYPLMGEYEKRETYDDVDGKYAVYWLKRMIEDSSYKPTGNVSQFFSEKGYIRFECKDIEGGDKQEMCKKLVKALEVKGCNNSGEHCEIYITKYKIGNAANENSVYFKDRVLVKEKTNIIKRFQVNGDTKENYKKKCEGKNPSDKLKENCERDANNPEFRSGFRDYIESLPNYTTDSIDGSRYRVIACFQHKKDNNNYYSYATIEVSR